jgi:hypothetical protein
MHNAALHCTHNVGSSSTLKTNYSTLLSTAAQQIYGQLQLNALSTAAAL